MKDALLLVFANKQDLNGGAYTKTMYRGRDTDYTKLCDHRKSQIASSWGRLPRTTYGRSSPAARQPERVFLRDW
jgi:hypothetical protein